MLTNLRNYELTSLRTYELTSMISGDSLENHAYRPIKHTARLDRFRGRSAKSRSAAAGIVERSGGTQIEQP